LAAWNYFESIDTPANKDFIAKWHEFTKKPNRTTNDPMEAHYIGFNMWVKGVEKAQSFDPPHPQMAADIDRPEGEREMDSEGAVEQHQVRAIETLRALRLGQSAAQNFLRLFAPSLHIKAFQRDSLIDLRVLRLQHASQRRPCDLTQNLEAA